MLANALLVFTWLAGISSIGTGVPDQAPGPGSRVVAIVGQEVISNDELQFSVGNRLLASETQLFKLRRAILEDMISTRLLDRAARERHLSVESLLQLEVRDRVPPVTLEEAKQVYSGLRDRFTDTSEQDALKSIMAKLQEGRIANRRQEFLRELRKRVNVDVMLEAPRVALSNAAAPTAGAPGAAVRIVVFSDFECPYCSRHAETMREIQRRYDGKVTIEFRHYPLSIHRNADRAAQAAVCADEQGKFWQLHDLMFAQQKALSDGLAALVTSTGMNVSSYQACMDSGRATAVVARDREEGTSLGVAATPATFVNGRLVAGAASLDEFISVIDEETERAVRSATSKATGSSRR